MQEIRQKNILSIICQSFPIRIKEYQIGVQNKLIDNSQVTLEPISIPEWDLGREFVLREDLLPELAPSGALQNIITAIKLLSRQAFAYPVSNPTAVNTGNFMMISYPNMLLYPQESQMTKSNSLSPMLYMK